MPKKRKPVPPSGRDTAVRITDFIISASFVGGMIALSFALHIFFFHSIFSWGYVAAGIILLLIAGGVWGFKFQYFKEYTGSMLSRLKDVEIEVFGG